MNDKELPAGWTRTTLDQVAVWGSGGTPKSGISEYYGGDIPWAIIGDLRDGPVSMTSSTITEEGLSQSSAKWIPEGAVLVAMYGSIGKLGITTRPLTTNQAIAFAIPHNRLIDARYLFWYLRSQRSALQGAGKGGTQQNISQTVLRSWPIVLPPIAEQQRIVDTLEDHLSRLDKATSLVEQSTSRAKALLPRLMAAQVLREETPRVRLDSIAEVRLGRQRSPKNHSGDQMRPYIRAANVGWRGLILDDVKKMNFTDSEVKTFRLHRNDIVLSEASGSPGEVGKPAIWNEEIKDCCFQNTLIRVRPTGVDPNYLLYFLRCEALRGAFRQGSRGVGIHHLGAAKLAAWSVSLPSIAEQRHIVETLDDQVSRLEAASTVFHGTRATARVAGTLRVSLLNRAFSGNLVPQVPTDEPAFELLARIQAERHAQGKVKRTRRTPALSKAKSTVTPHTLPPSPAPEAGTPLPPTAVQQEFEL